MFKIVGQWWNNKNIKLVEIDGIVYALNNWNGETYNNCWICLGENLMDASQEEYTIKPSSKLDNFLPNSESAFIFSSLFAPAYSRASATMDGSIESVKILSALIPLEPE